MGDQKVTITHSRPIMTISIVVENCGQHCILTRKEEGFFGSKETRISVKHSYEECVEGITKWAEGDLVQDAVPSWTPQLREWLITGMTLDTETGDSTCL